MTPGQGHARRSVRRLVVAVTAFTAAVALTGVAAASTGTLDQSFTRSGNLSEVISSVCPYAGQTFTAGRTGTLTGVELDVFGFVPNLLNVQFRTVTDTGIPSNTILGHITLPSNSSVLGQMVTFPQRIHITAGRQYAIVAHYEGSIDAYYDGGLWNGGTENAYASGAMVVHCINAGWRTNHDGWDLHFQDYVAN
jgi:hypothetical protein